MSDPYVPSQFSEFPVEVRGNLPHAWALTWAWEGMPDGWAMPPDARLIITVDPLEPCPLEVQS